MLYILYDTLLVSGLYDIPLNSIALFVLQLSYLESDPFDTYFSTWLGDFRALFSPVLTH